MSARITEAMVEAAARKLCRLGGYDPDGKDYGHKVKTWEAFAKTAEACLAAALSTEPGEAEVLVPREPTEEMLISGCAIPGVSLETGRRMYRAMLAASPRQEEDPE